MSYVKRAYPLFSFNLQKHLDGIDVSYIMVRCNVTSSDIVDWLSGERAPTLNQVAVICDFLGVSTQKLLGSKVDIRKLNSDLDCLLKQATSIRRID